MQQLTGLDASFLALETASSTGHVGGLAVLDPKDAPKPLTLPRLTEVLAQRVPLVPVLRRKLLNVPLGLDQPYWVDDPDFDIEYHVRELALPRPGSDAQLTEQVSRLHARPLDRSRPLWEIYLITGLARRRAAVYTKIHHAAIDGASGAELLTVLLDLTPAGRELPPVKPWHPEKAPSWPELAARAAAKAAWRPVQTVRITNELVKVLPTLAPAVSTVVGGMLGLTRVNAAEAGRKGVRVNALCPGPVTETMMSKELGAVLAKKLGVSPEEQLAGFLGGLLQGRGQTADEIARAALFLCSDQSSAITGQAINVDGGAAFF